MKRQKEPKGDRSQPACKIDILYDSNYTVFWKHQNYEDSKKICDCQRFAAGRIPEGQQHTKD